MSSEHSSLELPYILLVIFMELKKIYFYVFCMSVLPACTYVHHTHAWCLERPEAGVGSPETGVTVVRHMWVLGTESGSSGVAAGAGALVALVEDWGSIGVSPSSLTGHRDPERAGQA